MLQQLGSLGWKTEVVVAGHVGRQRTQVTAREISLDHPNTLSLQTGGADWSIEINVQNGGPADGLVLRVHASVLRGTARQVAIGLRWTDRSWSPHNYVLIPGAVYQGNRFDAFRRSYPPGIRDLGQKSDPRLLDIGDLPRLSSVPGRSHLDQLSVDAATPGLGIYFPDKKTGWLLLTPQHTSLGHYGMEVIENDDRTQAEVLWLTPGFLHPIPGEPETPHSIGDTSSAHQHRENGAPVDLTEGCEVVLEARLHVFPAESIQELFDQLFQQRTAAFPQDPPMAPILPFSAVWDILEEKHNQENWCESHGIYQVGIPWLEKQHSQFWQNGWIGGGQSILPLMLEGHPRSMERARRNLDFLLAEGISGAGFFKAIMSPEKVWSGDGFNDWDGGPKPLTLVRRNGDCLLFALRMLALLRARHQPVPRVWEERVRQCASAWSKVWRQEHHFGFLLDYETGQIAIGGSTSGALLPAALVMASDYFCEPDYLRVAEESALCYATKDLALGVTTGGPGDAVQAPDSESIFALVESFIALHEATGSMEWLTAARAAISQAASWVVSYRHRFPAHSALGLLDMDARGTMLANAQNKCAVPGICTLSGEGLLRTFRACGDHRLIELLREIAHAQPAFLSRNDRPIQARIGWGHPGKSHLPHGWMCERVNLTPSWNEPLGEQAAYSCWCEVAMMLTWSDLPGIYAQPDTGYLCVLDHVTASWKDETRTCLRVTNPTDYPARVKLLVETGDRARRHKLPTNFASALPQIHIPPRSNEEFSLSAS